VSDWGVDVADASRYLFVAGALPYFLLGMLHALATPRGVEEARGLSPRDPAIRAAMQAESLVMTRRTSLWSAWVGFNFSHSLGAVLFGAVVVLLGRSSASLAPQAHVFMPLAILTSSSYLFLAGRYWFRTPIVGIAVSTACFVSAYALFLLGR